MSDKIVTIVPTQSGWRALYRGEYEEDGESARVVAWALVEDEQGARTIVGMVVDPNDPTKIVPAPDGASPLAPDFERYGFRER